MTHDDIPELFRTPCPALLPQERMDAIVAKVFNDAFNTEITEAAPAE